MKNLSESKRRLCLFDMVTSHKEGNLDIDTLSDLLV